MTPLVAHSLEGSGFAILLEDDRLLEFGFVIHNEGDEYILMHMLCYFWFAKHSCLHLAAVDTTKAVEVQEHRHIILFGICHTFFVVGKGDLSAIVGHGGILAIGHRQLAMGSGCTWCHHPILSVHRWREGRDSAQRCAPQTWNHVHSKSQ